jgi:plasmid stabilization system protein ParE
MVFNVNLTQEASDQLNEAIAYYQKRGKGAAFLNQVNDIFDLISQNPELFPIEFKNYRKATVQKFPYLVIYFTDVKNVIVTSVFNTYQNPKNKFTQ